MESLDGYEDDYRFNPRLDDVVPFIYRTDIDASTYSYWEGDPVELLGATQMVLGSVGAIVASLAFLFSFSDE